LKSLEVVPEFQLFKIIQDVFGVETLRTLNASESIARGCAIQAAQLSPLFKVAEYGVEDNNYYPIRCSWLFLNSEEGAMNVENDSKNNVQKQTSLLFDKGCPVPSVKAITFHKEDPLIDFKLNYDPVPEGIDQLLAHYVIHNQKPKEQEFGVKVRVILNKNGILEFESANLNEDYYEDIPVEKKEGEQPPAEEEGQSISGMVNQDICKELEAMGFSKNTREKALLMTGNASIEQALEWLDQHKEDQHSNQYKYQRYH